MATILIVDDDAGFVSSTAELLKAEGYSVLTAGDTVSGMSSVDSGNPDLILLDITLKKEEDGLVFAHDLITKGKTIPIILLAGVAAMAGASFEKAAEITVEAYAEKPVDTAKLKQKIKAILTR